MIDYKCSKCGRKDVKLWRDYNTCLDYQELTCYLCTPDFIEVETAIGWKVAACPTYEFDTFWGYCAVPSDRVQWWWELPL